VLLTMDVDSLISEVMPQKLVDISETNGNSNCVDCKESNPSWASLGFGTVVCLTCAGRHRSLGTHVTLVRSMTLDSWTSSQIDRLSRGGNIEFLKYASSLKHGQLNVCETDLYSLPRILYYRSEVLILYFSLCSIV
jgi:hypothetical protein